MKIKILDILDRHLEIGSRVKVGDSEYLIYFGKYQDSREKNHFGLYLTKSFSSKAKVSDELLSLLKDNVISTSIHGTIKTNFIKSDGSEYDTYIKMIRKKVIETIKSDDKYVRFTESDAELEEIIQGYAKEFASKKNFTLYDYLEDYSSFYYCPSCKKFTTSRVTKQTVVNASEFPSDYDFVCQQCYNNNRY